MPSLHELQREFSACVRFGETARMSPWIVAAGIDPAKRLQIYRNNSNAGFLSAMRLSFPVIERLSGEEWFAQSVCAYQRAHPSRSGDLQFVGDRYADYLQGELAGTPHEYFSDVARLEWAYQQVLTAASGSTLKPAELQGISALEYEHLRFESRPDLRLVHSMYPLLAIWRANQIDAAADATPIRLDQGGGSILLIRRADHVELRELAPDSAALLRQFARGVAFGMAVDAVAAQCGDFDLSRCFQDLLTMQSIATLQLPKVSPCSSTL